MMFRFLIRLISSRSDLFNPSRFDCLRALETVASNISGTSSSRFAKNWFVGSAVGQYGPDRPGQLICQCSDNHIKWAPPQDLGEPGPIWPTDDDRPRRMH